MTHTIEHVATGRTCITRAIETLRGLLPRSAPSTCGTKAEIERLAHLSPHLLDDVGFLLDDYASSPQRQIWRRGALTLILEPAAGRPAPKVIGRIL